MSKIQPPNQLKELPGSVIKNMIMLATSGFGVVVALAWNEAIKASVETYIAPYLGVGSGVVSLFIYAALMTFLSVIVTMQLAGIERRFGGDHRITNWKSREVEKNKASKPETKGAVKSAEVENNSRRQKQ